MKFPTNSGDTAKDVSSIDWRTTPYVTYCDTSRNKDIISTALFGRNSDALILKAMKMFHYKTLMVLFGEDIMIEMQRFAHSDEGSFKSNFIVQENKMIETEYYQDMLHKEYYQRNRTLITDRDNDYELTHVTHRIHKSHVTIRIFVVDWRSQVNI